MWLLQKLRPDHKTIADFRKNNLKPMRPVCREFTLLCKQLDLCAGELVAIDGSQCKAVNAKERNFTADKLKNLLQQIDPRVEGDRKDLEGQDNDDDAGTPVGPSRNIYRRRLRRSSTASFAMPVCRPR